MPLPQNAQLIYSDLIAAGATATEAAGIAGNAYGESGGNPEEVVLDSNDAYSRGLWMMNDQGAGAGVNWSQYITGNVQQDIANQVALLKSQGGFGDASGSTPAAAALSFEENYEHPASISASAGTRESAASSVASAASTGNWSASGGTSPSVSPGDPATTGGTGSTGANANLSSFQSVGTVGTLLQYLDGFLNPSISAVPGIVNLFTDANGIVSVVMTFVDRGLGVIVGAGMVYLGFHGLMGGGGGRGPVTTILSAGNLGVRAGELALGRQAEQRRLSQSQTRELT